MAPGQRALVLGAQQIAAILSLGVPTLATVGEILPVDTGLVRATAAGKSGVFGVDVFQRTSTQFLPLLAGPRSEEHTSELQSRGHLVCRLLLEKKKTRRRVAYPIATCAGRWKI